MYICVYVCMLYVCKHVCMYVRTYVCMYACMHAYIGRRAGQLACATKGVWCALRQVLNLLALLVPEYKYVRDSLRARRQEAGVHCDRVRDKGYSCESHTCRAIVGYQSTNSKVSHSDLPLEGNARSKVFSLLALLVPEYK